MTNEYLKERNFRGNQFSRIFFTNISRELICEFGFTEDFPGINFRELNLIKDFAGINFREAPYKESRQSPRP